MIEEGNVMGKIIWQELGKTLREIGDRLKKFPVLDVVIAAPLLGAGFILLLFVAGAVFLSSISKS